MLIFDNLINLICSKRQEIKININSNNISEFIPKIYYIGDGKTGSASIKNGFPDVNVAHWHTTQYFEQIYNTKLLSYNNLDLYDLIIYIGNKFNFKPIIIESIRNPIELGISRIFQHIKKDREHKTECKMCNIKKIKKVKRIIPLIKDIILCHEKNNKCYSISMYKKHFDIDLISNFNLKQDYYFNNTKKCYLLLLKFENIINWETIINNCLQYKFILKHTNKTKNIKYKKVKKNIKFSRDVFKLLYDREEIACFYSNNEINKIKEKYIKKTI